MIICMKRSASALYDTSTVMVICRDGGAGGGQGGQLPPQLSRQGGLVPPAKYSTYKFEKLKVIKLLVSYLSLSETLFMNDKFR